MRIPDESVAQNNLFTEVNVSRSDALSDMLGVEIKFDNESYNQAKINKDNDKRYQKELAETVFNKKISDHVINVVQTPEVLKAIGVKDLPITITPRVINKAKNTKHNISYIELADLPSQLREPLMVFKSQSRDDSIVVFTEHNDINGLPVIIAVHLNKQEARYNVNRIASVYGLANFDSKIEKWISKGDLLYIDEEKSSKLLRSRGLQLPKEEKAQSKENNSDPLQSRGLQLPKEGENKSKYSNSDSLQSIGLQLPKEGENKSYKTRSDIFNIPDKSKNVKKNAEEYNQALRTKKS